jgi:hypothetical protein
VSERATNGNGLLIDFQSSLYGDIGQDQKSDSSGIYVRLAGIRVSEQNCGLLRCLGVALGSCPKRTPEVSAGWVSDGVQGAVCS